MFKTYLRLLQFASPISRYAVPYFFTAALHALFNTATYALIIPILNTMFDKGFAFVPTYQMPAVALKEEALTATEIPFSVRLLTLLLKAERFQLLCCSAVSPLDTAERQRSLTAWKLSVT